MKRFAHVSIALILFSAASVPAFANNFGNTVGNLYTSEPVKAMCHGRYKHGKAPTEEHLQELSHDPALLAQVGPIDDLPLPSVTVLDPCDPANVARLHFLAAYSKDGILVGITAPTDPNDANSAFSIYLLDNYNSISGGDSVIIHELVHYYRGTRRAASLSGKLPTSYSWDGPMGSQKFSEHMKAYGYDPAEECSAYEAEFTYVLKHGQTNIRDNLNPIVRAVCEAASKFKE